MVNRPEPMLLNDQVFAALRDAITTGALPAGARLRLRDLAAEYGTSPIPVREAIGRLEQVGLVERVPHKGAVVVDLTDSELVQIYQTRLVLEVAATRLGSQAADDRTVARMRVEHGKMMTAVRRHDLLGALDRDEALLSLLYAAGGNAVMLELIGNLWRRCRPYKLLGLGQQHDASVVADVWSHQGRLIEAVAAHDTGAAVAITQTSLNEAASRIQDQLSRSE